MSHSPQGRVPSQKGVSVLPVVVALKRHPDGRKLVPERLWKYFDEHLVVSGWYPERDYWVRQYHDTGRMEVTGGSAETNSVFMRLSGFVIPLEGFVRLQGYYLDEYGRLVGMELRSKVTLSTARGDKFCEWEHQLVRSPATEAFVRSLPTVR
jgi:hypothetical protein